MPPVGLVFVHMVSGLVPFLIDTSIDQGNKRTMIPLIGLYAREYPLGLRVVLSLPIFNSGSDCCVDAHSDRLHRRIRH